MPECPAAPLLSLKFSETGPFPSLPCFVLFFPFRNGGGDWRESRNTRQEDQDKALADKRKKLLRAIPSTIPGVSAVVKVDARSDIREIEALVDMQVQ